MNQHSPGCRPAKSVLITGASGGIGQALVARFGAAGWRVIPTDRRDSELIMDVTDEASVQAARARVGVPDVVINNAGLGLFGPLAELPDDSLVRQFEVNVRGLARVTRAFVPDMCRRGSGRVINVGSLAGVFTPPFFGGYAATKHAVEAMSDALRLEVAPFGVQVCLIEPSVVGTAFVEASLASLGRAAVGSSWREPMLETVARRDAFRPVEMTAEQVAAVIFHAATARRPRARYRVGALASWLIRALGMLPTPLRDALLRAAGGLRKLPAPHPANAP